MLNGVDQYLGYLPELNLVVSCIVSITKHHQTKIYIELHVNYTGLYIFEFYQNFGIGLDGMFL